MCVIRQTWRQWSEATIGQIVQLAPGETHAFASTRIECYTFTLAIRCWPYSRKKHSKRTRSLTMRPVVLDAARDGPQKSTFLAASTELDGYPAIQIASKGERMKQPKGYGDSVR
jgi:hypothetical protein